MEIGLIAIIIIQAAVLVNLYNAYDTANRRYKHVRDYNTYLKEQNESDDIKKQEWEDARVNRVIDREVERCFKNWRDGGTFTVDGKEYRRETLHVPNLGASYTVHHETTARWYNEDPRKEWSRRLNKKIKEHG